MRAGRRAFSTAAPGAASSSPWSLSGGKWKYLAALACVGAAELSFGGFTFYKVTGRGAKDGGSQKTEKREVEVAKNEKSEDAVSRTVSGKQ
jgi:hypothetical protein